MYKYEEVYNETLNYFNGDELATKVWIDKYCLKDANDNLLEKSPDETIIRIAKEFARIEQKYPNPLSYEEIYKRLKGFKRIIPGGSIIFGVGNDHSFSTLGSCFVIGNTSDSYSGIMQTDEEQVQLMKRRGGVGHDLSHIRPKGSLVSNSAKTSTGVVSFMERYSNSTREVSQNGRRGALMLTLDVNHPDIEEFISAKDDLTKITGANISIKIDDNFMETLIIGEDSKTKNIWDKLIHQAWKSAEPGVLFWDTIKKESPADCYENFQTISTNPCGEIPLSVYDSCRLLSINLYEYVDNPFTKKAKFNFPKFIEDVKIAQRLMDDVIDLEQEKIEKILEKVGKEITENPTEYKLWKKIKKSLLEGRRTGLSAIGLGDMLAALGLQYGTEKASNFTEKVYKEFAINAYKSSINLAKERGNFPVWDLNKEIKNPFIRRIMQDISNESIAEFKFNTKYGGQHPTGAKEDTHLYKFHKTGRRNIACLTIPPSGTISMMGQITSGIEPVYEVVYKRRRKVDESNPNKVFQDKVGDWWEEYNVFHPKFIEWYSIVSGNSNISEVRSLLENSTEEMINKLIKESPYYKSSSSEIDYLEKVRMQGRIQKWIDHSISVTHNLPNSITEEEVSKIYFEAWKSGCKGVTVYRDGSRDGVISKKELKKEAQFKEHHAPKRPKEIKADYYYTKSQGKEYAVIVGLLEDKPFEVFAFENPPSKRNTTGVTVKIKKGHYKFINGEFEIENLQVYTESKEEKTHTIYSSGLLRHGAPIKYVVKTIRKTNEDITSFGAAIRRTLSKYVVDGETMSEQCEECGNTNLIYQGGCLQCTCGWSKCG